LGSNGGGGIDSGVDNDVVAFVSEPTIVADRDFRDRSSPEYCLEDVLSVAWYVPKYASKLIPAA
jgi:hypothetical protein